MEKNESGWRIWLRFLWTGSFEEEESRERESESKVYQRIYAIPETAEYRQVGRRQQTIAAITAMLFGALLGFLYTAANLDNIFVPLVVVSLVIMPMILWRFPAFAFYFVLAVCCLIEVYPRYFPDSITDRIPLWFSINWLVQLYAGGGNPGIAPVNPFEIIVLFIGVTNLLRLIYFRDQTFRTGDLFYLIIAYIVFVTIATIHGLLTGGDFEMTLQSARSQVYMLLAFSMAVNLIESRKQVSYAFWIAVICIGIKGILYAYRRHITLAGQDIGDQGVGSHEEAFFFCVFVAMLAIFSFTRTHRKLTVLMWILLPTVILGFLATNRRAGTAAAILSAPVLFIGFYAAYPRSRKPITALALGTMAVAYPYYQIYKYSDATIAQPARAVRSQFEPDERDLASNLYREAENYNIFYTTRQYPLGYGFGKPFILVAPMADISKIYTWWRVIPHNNILWLWQCTGIQGFFAFWLMISVALIRCVFYLRRTDITDEDKAMVLVAMICVPLLLLFGLLDLQLANVRDVLMTFLLLGLTCSNIKEIPAWDWRKGPKVTENAIGALPGENVTALERRS